MRLPSLFGLPCLTCLHSTNTTFVYDPDSPNPPIHLHNSQAELDNRHRANPEASVAFLQLADELLFLILEDPRLSTADLYSLAATCRHLNFLAIPIYLSRHGISDLYEGCYLSREKMGVLDGLRISISITSLNHLHCTFNEGNDRFLRELRSLCRLISKLSHIKSIFLDFSWVGPWDVSQQTTGPASTVNWSSWTWQWVFFKTLNDIIGKCSDLTVFRGYHLTQGTLQQPSITPNTNMRPHLAVGRTFNRIRTFVSTRLRLHASGKKCTSPACPPSRVPTIKTLNIRSMNLLDPPFDTRTIKPFNTSPITTLSLDFLILSQQMWAEFLSGMTLPALSTLSITSCSIAFAHLSKFLFRHPNITALNTSNTHITYSDSRPFLKKKHPRLKSFSGNPEHISQFLDSSRAFPSLDVICISPRLVNDELVRLDCALLDASLTAIARHSKVTFLCLNLSGQSGFERWLEMAASNVASGRVKKRLGYVTSLELVFGGMFALSDYALVDLSNWLTMFPSLRHVYLNAYVEIEHGSDSPFIRSISRACPQIRTVRIADEELCVSQCHVRSSERFRRWSRLMNGFGKIVDKVLEP